MQGRRGHKIADSLIAFWSEMTNARPFIHPRDKTVIDGLSPDRRELLKTDYPPPAFIGDIKRARVFLLWGNGGYDAERTAREFAQPSSAENFLERLKYPTPWTTLRFQQQDRMRNWLERGEAVVVNAMAYRSSKITKPVCEIADQLPSVKHHREWLRSDLIPACGDVMVIVHRPRLWKLSPSYAQNDLLLFTPNPASGFLSEEVCQRVEDFLAGTR